MSVPVGTTQRLRTTFTVSGTATDPTTVSLVVREPDGTSTTYTYAGATVTKEGTGIYYRDVLLDAAGIWSWEWTGTGTAPGVDRGTLTVDRSLLGAGVLCSPDDVKLQMETTSTTTDDVLQSLILAASRAIEKHTGREFAPPPGNPLTRVFDIGDYLRFARTSGIPIGDLATTPTAVALIDNYGDSVSTLTVADDVQVLPTVRAYDEPITDLRLRPTVVSLSIRYQLQVTGTFGFPAIPEDVAQACVITVRSWMRPASSGWSEPIEGFSGQNYPAPSGGWMLPMAAKQLLSAYRRIGVG